MHLGHTGAEDELSHRTREEVEVAQVEAGGRNAQIQVEQQLAARQWTQHEGLRRVGHWRAGRRALLWRGGERPRYYFALLYLPELHAP